ncbi:MAG: hypothetical protein LWX56_09710 [Ignavibacteria bacterium]|nr:hypothetical protein [Ignavibacteria bacterium]
MIKYTIIASLAIHALLFLFFTRSVLIQPETEPVQLTTLQVTPYDAPIPKMAENRLSASQDNAVKKPGVIPAKVAKADGGKKGGSIAGFNGTTGEEGIKNSGTGTGAGSGGEGGTGVQGTDVYRVGVEEMPEPYGGTPAILGRLAAAVPEASTFRGRTVYVWVFVDESGIVRKTQISKGLGGGIDAAISGIIRSTRFRPGKDKGKKVKVQMMLNVTITG